MDSSFQVCAGEGSQIWLLLQTLMAASNCCNWCDKSENLVSLACRYQSCLCSKEGMILCGQWRRNQQNILQYFAERTTRNWEIMQCLFLQKETSPCLGFGQNAWIAQFWISPAKNTRSLHAEEKDPPMQPVYENWQGEWIIVAEEQFSSICCFIFVIGDAGIMDLRVVRCFVSILGDAGIMDLKGFWSTLKRCFAGVRMDSLSLCKYSFSRKVAKLGTEYRQPAFQSKGLS